MRRNLLKEHSTLLEAALRFADPLLRRRGRCHRVFRNSTAGTSKARYVDGAARGRGRSRLPCSRRSSSTSRSAASASPRKCAGSLVAWLAIAVTGGVFLFLTKTGSRFSREWALVWIAGGFVAHVAVARRDPRRVARAAAARAQPAPHRHRRRRGARPRDRRAPQGRAVERAQRARVLRRRSRSSRGSDVDGIPVLGNIDRVAEDLEQEDPADQVWIALPLRAENRIREILTACGRRPSVGALRAGHLQLPPAASLDDRGRGHCR